MSTLSSFQPGLLQRADEHLLDCSCRICDKQKEISQIRAQRARLNHKTIYKNDFSSMKRAGSSISRCSEAGLPSYGYLDLKSTYGSQYSHKRSDTITHKPPDNLATRKSILPKSTTYMQSYFSMITPKPDDPIKNPDTPIGNGLLPFSSQTIYKKAFKQQYRPEPTQPFSQRSAIGLPKSIGTFESTHHNSYHPPPNPQKKQRSEMIKQSNTITSLPALPGNFDTTYRNFFVGIQRGSHRKCDLDQIGNINWKANRRGVGHSSFH